MNNTTAVAKFLAQSNALPVAKSDLVMDMDRLAWMVQLQYLTGSFAASACEEQLGTPDKEVLFGLVAKRWTFAGTTVELRGRVVTITESF